MSAPRIRPADAWAFLVLRVGLAAVLLWFGIAELHDPASWAVFVPHFLSPWRAPLMALHATLLLASGAFLLVGLLQRAAAGLGALLLLVVLGSLLVNGAVDSVFVRDIGLAAAAAALALSPSATRVASVDALLADARVRRRTASAVGYAVMVVAVAGVLAATAVPDAGASSASVHDLSGIGSGGFASGGLSGGAGGSAASSPSGAASAIGGGPSGAASGTGSGTADGATGTLSSTSALGSPATSSP